MEVSEYLIIIMHGYWGVRNTVARGKPVSHPVHGTPTYCNDLATTVGTATTRTKGRGSEGEEQSCASSFLFIA